MRASNTVSLVAVIGLLPTEGVVAAEAGDAALVMTIADDTIELTVPVSALSLRIPKGDLASVEEPKSGAQASSRYFHLQDSGRGLVVSGWFEPANSFQGFEAFWTSEFSSMKKAGLVPTAAPTAVAVGNWSGAAYELALPKGAGEGVKVLEFLKSIVVNEKN